MSTQYFFKNTTKKDRNKRINKMLQLLMLRIRLRIFFFFFGSLSNGVYEYAPDPNCSIPVPKIRKNNHLRVYTATGTEPFLKERQFQNDSFF